MRRTTTIALLAACALAVAAWPAEGATPIGKLKQRVTTLERQIRVALLQDLNHDQLQVTTVTAPVAWTPVGFGKGTATCPLEYQVTGGGVQWSGSLGTDSFVYYSQPTGSISWSVAVNSGSGAAGTAYAVAQCAKLG